MRTPLSRLRVDLSASTVQRSQHHWPHAAASESFFIDILDTWLVPLDSSLPFPLSSLPQPLAMSSQPMEVVLANKPKNEPDSNTFKLQPIANPPTAPPSYGVLLQLVVASVDPYQRGSIRRLEIGSQVTNYQVARVLESDNPKFHKGDLVLDYDGKITWQTVQQHSGDGLYRIPPELNLPATVWAGVLGMPGRTAYFGLLDDEVGRMRAGKVVLVSGAAGAVGSLAGQLAKIKGAKKVIGTAGGPEKCKRVKEHYGFDECLDYKQLDTVQKMTEALKKAAPEGVDIYFDNTGGHVTTAAFQVFNKFARMVLCGCISAYNKDPEDDLVPNVLSAHATHILSHALFHTTQGSLTSVRYVWRFNCWRVQWSEGHLRQCEHSWIHTGRLQGQVPRILQRGAAAGGGRPYQVRRDGVQGARQDTGRVRWAVQGTQHGQGAGAGGVRQDGLGGGMRERCDNECSTGSVAHCSPASAQPADRQTPDLLDRSILIDDASLQQPKRTYTPPY